MFGIFQLFSISVIFWSIVSALRFIFETLHAPWKKPGADTYAHFFMAGVGGVALTAGLFFLFLFEFDFVSSVYTGIADAIVFPAMALWFLSVSFGAYIAARLYTVATYSISLSVGLGAAAGGVVLLFNTEAGRIFIASQGTETWVGWGVLSVGTALLGSYLARGVNIFEERKEAAREGIAKLARIRPEEVAVVIAAHNEELTIGETIESLLQITTPDHIYIASDGSKDKTVEIVRSYGCNVEDIQPNRGKAGALVYMLRKNDLTNRYKAVFFMDADIKVHDKIYQFKLPYFDDPRVIAVSAYFATPWPRHFIPRRELLITAYRIRLWRVLQFFVRYGQTWKYANMSPIVPGGASIYRSTALKQIQIDTPGLVIEDFNMTFQIHHKKLGLIIFEPRALVFDQEPYTIKDFVSQIKRWYLGYFQTMRHHGIWPSFFCFFTYFFTFELIISSILFIFTPFLLLELILSGKEYLFLNLILFGYPVTVLNILISVLVLDYLITIAVAIIERKPILLLYGLAFYPIRYIEAVVFLSMLPMTFIRRSDGRWKSPARKTFEALGQ
ncbi:glycosyltransferase family 2 protein [Candidatus Parcubacteria bacterium]|nr:MAG: glycosyltransferase family 2 protein [Candidatus Parcubacteria bacterium]